jgi:hypothetical protein
MLIDHGQRELGQAKREHETELMGRNRQKESVQ